MTNHHDTVETAITVRLGDRLTLEDALALLKMAELEATQDTAEGRTLRAILAENVQREAFEDGVGRGIIFRSTEGSGYRLTWRPDNPPRPRMLPTARDLAAAESDRKLFETRGLIGRHYAFGRLDEARLRHDDERESYSAVERRKIVVDFGAYYARLAAPPNLADAWDDFMGS